jgi:hypothetical protein
VDGGGFVTVVLRTGLQEAVVDGTTATFTFTGTVGARRPASFPTEAGSPSVMRLLAQSTQVDGATARVLVPASGSVQVNIAAGLTLTRVNVATVVGNYPTLALRNTGAGTTLASASVASVPAVDSTVHTTLTASATITSSTTVAPRITVGTNVTYTAGSGTALQAPQWQGVRWLSIWTGTDTGTDPVDGSMSNLLWHRAQQVLKGVAVGTRYTVTGVDLDHLLKGAAPLALGQSVRLRSDRLGINDTVKIVRLDYRFDQTESLNLELGTITPRLTGVTFDL